MVNRDTLGALLFGASILAVVAVMVSEGTPLWAAVPIVVALLVVSGAAAMGAGLLFLRVRHRRERRERLRRLFGI